MSLANSVANEILKPQNENIKTIYVLNCYCSYDNSWYLDNAYENKEDAEERAKEFLEDGYAIEELKLFKSNK